MHKRLEEQLQKHRNELAHVSRLNTMGEMATGLAHEINQPLAAMSNYCYVGQRSVENGKSVDVEFLQDLFKNLGNLTRRTAEIIRRIRDLVGKRPSVRKPIVIHKPVQEVINLLQSDLRSSDIAVELSVNNEGLVAMIDEIQIQQVLINLIRNAIDAMDRVSHEKILQIDASHSDDRLIEVTVRDTGGGIPESNDDVFDPFVTDKPGGLGMGLAISRTIIESHGGQLWMTTNSSGGATFHFTLPVPGAECGAEPGAESQESEGGETVSAEEDLLHTDSQ